LSVLLGQGIAHAQDACVALIQNAMYDTISNSNYQQSNSQARNSFCSWYSSYRQQNTGASANVGIPIGDIPVNIGGSYTYGSADSLYKAMCQSSASASASDSSFADVEKYVDRYAAQAFDNCIKAEQQGLKGTAFISDDSSVFNLDLIYQPPAGVSTGTTIQSISISPADAFSCPNPTIGQDVRTYVGQNQGFKNVYASLSCSRTLLPTPINVGSQPVSAKAGMISINTDAGSYTQIFKAIPAPDPLTDTEKVMSAMPIGAIIAWVGGDAPKGWRVCDGTNGTPDLNHRIPRGTLAPGELRAKAGAPDHTHGYSGKVSVPSGAPNDHVVQDGGSPLGVPGWDHIHTYGGDTGGASNPLPEVTYVMFIMKYQ
jgi:hypothetical protein